MNNANWQWGAAINLTSFKERTIYPISATATAAITGMWNVGAVYVCFLFSCSIQKLLNKAVKCSIVVA